MHHSPKRSPKKRPQTSTSPTKRANASYAQEKSTLTHIKIIEELNGQALAYQDHDIEIERLTTTIDTLNNRVKITQDLQLTVETLQNRLADSERAREMQEAEISAQADQLSKYEKTIEALNTQNQTLDAQNQTLNQQNQALLATNQTLEKTCQSQRNRIADLNQENKNQRNDIQLLIQQKQELQDQIDNATEYIITMEEKVYKSNKISLELLKQLKDAEIEISTLQQYIVDLKQRIAVYIPIKEDHVDRKLAEFINNYPERSKLKIMFMRESEGVYQFGSKRVAVKVEKDNIKIRVGGGYLSIDEFLDQYTPVELEKLERKDPLKRFSEKVAIQKTIVGNAVREGSPIRASSPAGVKGSPSRRSNNFRVGYGQEV